MTEAESLLLQAYAELYPPHLDPNTSQYWYWRAQRVVPRLRKLLEAYYKYQPDGLDKVIERETELMVKYVDKANRLLAEGN